MVYRVFEGGEGEPFEAPAELHGLDLDQSFAYADSHSDLPMLSCVGNPVAVSPDVPLMRAAGRNGWSVVEWRIAPRSRLAVLT